MKTDPLALQAERHILLIRQHRVMLDYDLATLYGVEARVLNQAVKRNLERFPDDFMFQLTAEEAECLRFQFGTLKRGQHFKYLPQVFTQEGVAMLSSILRSPRAVQVNIAIMRVFVRLCETLAFHRELDHKLAELERKIEGHDTSIRACSCSARRRMRSARTWAQLETGTIGEGNLPFREPGRHTPAKGVHVSLRGPNWVFLTVCTEKREPWLARASVQRTLHGIWETTATAWLVSDYLLMPDHLHLFCAPRDLRFTIERWIGFWKDRFAKAHPDAGKFQAGGFHHRLRSDESYAQKWQYVRENPVRHGLIGKSEEWPCFGRVHEIRW